jgi:hypothetical protein
LGKSEDKAKGEEESGEKVKNNKNTISASPTTDKARENILGLIDSFIEQITTIRMRTARQIICIYESINKVLSLFVLSVERL